MHLVPYIPNNKPTSHQIPLHRGTVKVVEVLVGTPLSDISTTGLTNAEQVVVGPWGKRILDKICNSSERPIPQLIGFLTPWVIGLDGEIPYGEICAAARQDGFFCCRGEVGPALCKYPNLPREGLRIGMKPCDCERKSDTDSDSGCHCNNGIFILEPLAGGRVHLDGDSGRKHHYYDCHTPFAFGVDPRMLS